MTTKIKTIVFDMDGTLYQIDGNNNGYKNSSLEKNVHKNALRFILKTENCTKKEAKVILNLALKDKIGISNFLSKKYSISRENYFNVIWDISPAEIVQNFEIAVQIVNQIKALGLNLILLTAAPKIWQKTVIEYIGLNNVFDEIYAADSFTDKEEIFKKLSQKFSTKSILSIGDQLETDIKPASKLGFLTFLVKTPNDLPLILKLI